MLTHTMHCCLVDVCRHARFFAALYGFLDQGGRHRNQAGCASEVGNELPSGITGDHTFRRMQDLVRSMQHLLGEADHHARATVGPMCLTDSSDLSLKSKSQHAGTGWSRATSVMSVRYSHATPLEAKLVYGSATERHPSSTSPSSVLGSEDDDLCYPLGESKGPMDVLRGQNVHTLVSFLAQEAAPRKIELVR